MRIQCRTPLRELSVHLGVNLVQPGLGDHPPADGRLVGDQDAGEAGAAKPLDRLGRARQETDMARIGKVVHVLDQRPVPVEEDGRAPLTLPGAAAGSGRFHRIAWVCR